MRLPWSLAALLALAPAALAPAALAADWPDLSRPPPAGSAGDGSNDAALVVAIEDYFVAPDIIGAVDNGKAWVSWLRETRGVKTVKTLVNNQATRDEILQAADGVAQRVKPGGRLWVVFIGHGAPSRQRDDGMLVGVDAQQTDLGLESRSVTRTELLDRLDQGAQADTVLVLDACFSGKTAQGDLAPGLSPLKTVSAHLGARATILTAAKGDEYAGPLSDGRRPAFSYLVLGALRGWGDQDKDGTVTASEAAEYASDALFQTVTGRTQTPTVEGADLALARGREASPKLGELAVEPTRDLSGPVRVVDQQSGDGMTAADVEALLAAKQQREAIEAKEQALLAKLRRERESTLSELAAQKQAEARDLWLRMQPLLEGGGPEGAKAATAFASQFRSVEVAVEDVEGRHSRAVAIPEVAQADAFLATQGGTPGAPRAPGAVVTGKLGYRMVTVPAGTFSMGSPSSEKDRDDDETQHPVTISRPYLLGETEVTQGLWKRVMGNNPSHFSRRGDDCPVEIVSWCDAVVFANRLSAQEGLTAAYELSSGFKAGMSFKKCNAKAGSVRPVARAKGYRLPTEAEWEYAARAGEDTPYAGGADLEAVGWVQSNSGGKTHRVGGKRANAWGLYDLTGNVAEWTWDRYGSYPSGASTDPTGPDTGTNRVERGGDWFSYPWEARLAGRDGYLPHVRTDAFGLRLARSIP